MSSLKKRVADLEQFKPNIDPISIIIRFLAPGNESPNFNHIRSAFGAEWSRMINETEMEFERRVIYESSRDQNGNTSLLFFSENC